MKKNAYGLPIMQNNWLIGLSENPRPWLILNNDSHPFGDEEYMAVTLTTPHGEGIPLEDAD